ncbi:uncharacterized protein [Diabrotica undecimpunctata]|uniref:uncharacterized protein isoform X1 n=1 Tax=Diabrotica undecimpunctata TaxID=50387 RepID=UPI003B63EEDD
MICKFAVKNIENKYLIVYTNQKNMSNEKSNQFESDDKKNKPVSKLFQTSDLQTGTTSSLPAESSSSSCSGGSHLSPEFLRHQREPCSKRNKLSPEVIRYQREQRMRRMNLSSADLIRHEREEFFKRVRSSRRNSFSLSRSLDDQPSVTGLDTVFEADDSDGEVESSAGGIEDNSYDDLEQQLAGMKLTEAPPHLQLGTSSETQRFISFCKICMIETTECDICLTCFRSFSSPSQ